MPCERARVGERALAGVAAVRAFAGAVRLRVLVSIVSASQRAPCEQESPPDKLRRSTPSAVEPLGARAGAKAKEAKATTRTHWTRSWTVRAERWMNDLWQVWHS